MTSRETDSYGDKKPPPSTPLSQLVTYSPKSNDIRCYGVKGELHEQSLTLWRMIVFFSSDLWVAVRHVLKQVRHAMEG